MKLRISLAGVAMNPVDKNHGTEFLEKDPRVRKVIYSEKWKKSSAGPANSYLSHVFRKYDLALSMNTGDRGAVAILAASRRERSRLLRFNKACFKCHPKIYTVILFPLTKICM